MTELFNFICE